MGRAGDEEVLELGDAELCADLRRTEIGSILGCIGRARADKRVHRCGQALPQYVLGHLDKLAALDEGMGGLPGVFLTGAAFRGVGLPDCIKQAALASKKAMDFVTIVEAGTD